MSTPEIPPHRPPVPRYGEYAPIEPAASPASTSSSTQHPAAPNAAPPLRMGDLIASLALLVFGLFGVASAILNALNISLLMQQVYESYGVAEEYESIPAEGTAAAVIIISHIALYLCAVVVTVALIRQRRISFWMPLSAGVVAFAIMMTAMIAVALGDPALVDAVRQQQSL